MGSTPDIALLLGQALHTLNTKLTAALDDFGLAPRHHCVLSKALDGEFTQGQLAEMAQLDKTTMVVTVDELERQGLAERVPSNTDRRARIIRVTPAGKTRVELGQAVVDETYQEVLEELPARQAQAFVDTLTRLVNGPLATPVPSPRPVRRRS